MKKKGFTLIELLAVIIILAILALIIAPMIQDLIINARYGAAADSVLNYVHAANNQSLSDAIGIDEDYKLYIDDTHILETDINDSEIEKIKYNGKGPTYVYMAFDSNNQYVEEGHFCMWGYSIDYNFENGATKSNLNYCGEMEPEGEPSCDVLSNNKYDDTEVFKIKNIEDLVCISEMSKSGKNFEGKTIYLVKDIDFNSDSSYTNSNDTTYGDINGNGEVEGIKTELTTGRGFYPIGSSSTPFKGLFEGYAKSIKNLMISRGQDNVGLFGYNQGRIQGFTITSNITGNSNTGGVVGTSNGGVLNEVIYEGTVTGYGSHVGGVVGNITGTNSKITSILIKNITLNAGSAWRGGIIGWSDTSAGNIVEAIMERGALTSTTYISKDSNASMSSVKVYYTSNITGARAGSGDTWFALRDEMLNAYDKVLDTYIGGDNDNSGYYFDYDKEDNSIIIKRTDKNPITFTLKGSGTESDPYIIDNYSHYKEAATLAGSNDNHKLKITKDIDFEGKHYYALGTNGNLLTSDIDGDMHKLSNISFNCAENCGLISQNIGHKVEGIYLENVTIQSGNANVGALVGHNTGVIKGITAINIAVTGSSNTGGLVGETIDGSTVEEIIYSGSVIADSNNVGGVVGHVGGTNNKIISILAKNVTLSNGTAWRAGIVGWSDTATGNVLESVLEEGTLTPSTYIGREVNSRFEVTKSYGSNLISGAINGAGTIRYTMGTEMLNAYDKVLDTYIGGDNDNSGYYFDYESDDSSNIVIKRTKDAPITFTLSGSGTSSDPYIIDNYQHFKEATIKSNGNYVFKITNDIDFSGKHYYALGTNGNILGSDINGDMHTLSNISFNCAENCGLISQNNGKTIEGLNLENITITSSNENVGGLVGYNTGVIKGINANNITVTGNSNTGGLVGHTIGGTTVNEITFIGTVNGSNKNVGGVVGHVIGTNSSFRSILVKNLILNASSAWRAGVVGWSDTATGNVLESVIERGTLTPGTFIGREVNSKFEVTKSYGSNLISGANNGAGTIRYTLVPPTTITYNGEEIDSLSYYDNIGVLDTIIGGDNDSSGYYLQYNDSGDGIVVVKAGNTPTPSPTPDPGSGEPLESSSVGDNPPTCVLERVISRDAGIQPILTCTDEEGAPTIRSQWNVNKNATTNQFSDIGIIKNGTVNGNSKTVRPYWSTSDPISVPTPNTCYYFRFGAQDASGNWSYYVTSKCYYGFGRSND